MSPVIVVAGPTASGKSALAVGLAQKFGGEIVNADSLQVYKGLRIITALPEHSELQKAPHHLYGILDPISECSSLGWWVGAVHKVIRAIISRGNIPIVVGGTGLYIDGLINGITAIPDVPADVRLSTTKLFNELGISDFWHKLVALDPSVEQAINPTDSQRMKRAYEVKVATGESLTHWWLQKAVKPDYDFKVIFINNSREYLYKCCNERFSSMLFNGAVQEAINFRKMYGEKISTTIKSAIGLTEISRYLDNEITLADVVELAQNRTKQYAKRQLTWFRHRLKPDIVLDLNNATRNLEYAIMELENLFFHSMSSAAL